MKHPKLVRIADEVEMIIKEYDFFKIPKKSLFDFDGKNIGKADIKDIVEIVKFELIERLKQ